MTPGRGVESNGFLFETFTSRYDLWEPTRVEPKKFANMSSAFCASLCYTLVLEKELVTREVVVW